MYFDRNQKCFEMSDFDLGHPILFLGEHWFFLDKKEKTVSLYLAESEMNEETVLEVFRCVYKVDMV